MTGVLRRNMHQAREGQARWREGEEMLGIGLLFRFCCFVVILGYLWCFWERGCSFLLPLLSRSFLCSLILSPDLQIGRVGMVPFSWAAFLDDSPSFPVS